MDIPRELAIIRKNPRYILDLLLSVINVSCQTVNIVSGLPPIDNYTMFDMGRTDVSQRGNLTRENQEKGVVNEIHIHGDATFSSNRDINIGKVVKQELDRNDIGDLT